MIVLPKTIASDSGHWYDAKTGDPRYTILGANKVERPTTLRDARKFGYVPSVTTILKECAKPGLETWKMRQMYEVAFTTPRLDGESDDSHYSRCVLESKERAMKAAERGTELHTAIERAIASKGYGEQWDGHITELGVCLEKTGINLFAGNSERSFAFDGYGGKCDYSSEAAVVDFKSKDRIEDDKKLAYDEHGMQLASYRHGLGLPKARCLNAFIGVDDGKVVLHEWPEEDLRRHLTMFQCLLSFWRSKHQFYP